MSQYRRPEEFLDRLPFKISTREFRRRLRASGHCYAWGKKLMLTDEQFSKFIETLATAPKPAEEMKPCPSNSNGKAKSGTYAAVSTKSAFERARELINGN